MYGSRKVALNFENVGVNTTMWNFCLPIQHRQCYLYTNRSFACEYVARGHDSLSRRAPRTASPGGCKCVFRPVVNPTIVSGGGEHEVQE
jgi:hypothetical protein